MTVARSVCVRGVVQGVGFRPFVFRLAQEHALAGWVRNGQLGVDIHLEGSEDALDAFLSGLRTAPPPAASVTDIEVSPSYAAGMRGFRIADSGETTVHPSTRIAPDLPVCADCLQEMRDPNDPRFGYAYINCTNCGPRFSIIERLPYDRPSTAMRHWPMDAACAGEYADPANRRFHAQPVACPNCGPNYSHTPGEIARLLRAGAIVAIKGIGGYHLACDACNAEAVWSLRERKFRKEKPFAVMVRDLDTARDLVKLSPTAEQLVSSPARPIVLVPKCIELPGVAPDHRDLGVMLPYTPLHYLIFDAGAPKVLVMTSGNRSSEPIAFRDDDARATLSELADAIVSGERPIVRRVDDSVAADGPFGPMILRRSRGYAPGAVCTLPARRPILAVGADLKNTITLVADGQAFVSQHVGDLDHYEARRAFEQTIADLLAMYEIDESELLVAYDAHPQYASTTQALELPAYKRIAIQHHQAHIASVLAEREAWGQNVIGVSFDGTGYGDDGAIWGGEFFYGSVAEGFRRALHLRPALLPGGDAAARFPAQCAAGFLAQLDDVSGLHLPERHHRALELVRNGVRVFPSTSMGRLFDTASALLGFTREVTFEGQAAMWLEYLAHGASNTDEYPFPVLGQELDFRPLLQALIADVRRARPHEEIARAFHSSVTRGVLTAVHHLSDRYNADTVVLSGGVFQNSLLLAQLAESGLRFWTNRAVPANDGGISLGQAAIGCFHA